MKLKLSSLFILMGLFLFAQEKAYTSQNIAINKLIEGTLLTPNNVNKPNLVIIIAGDGPADRDGNQNFLMSNTLKKLALGITKERIATFRYDKRIVKQIRRGNIDDILFDDFVTDAISVIDYFKNTKKYSNIYVAGHSQGSLVGLLAAKGRADGFISLAGAGQSIDKLIIEQVAKTAPMFTEDTKRILDILREGKTTSDYPQALDSMFSKDIQPFIANWMSYDPLEEIKKLEMPILIINGTKDLQVSEVEAKLLNAEANESTLVIIEKMNHILVPIEGDDLENSKSYNEAYRKLSPKLLEAVISFVK